MLIEFRLDAVEPRDLIAKGTHKAISASGSPKDVNSGEIANMISSFCARDVLHVL